MDKPTSPIFPPDTEFFDVEGVPVVRFPTGAVRAWDEPGGRRFPLSAVSRNGWLIPREEFLAMISAGSARASPTDPGELVLGRKMTPEEFKAYSEQVGRDLVAGLNRNARRKQSDPSRQGSGEPPVVSRSDDGRRVMVLADPDIWGAFVDGVWTPDAVPDADDLKDNFSRVPDTEAAKFVAAARSAASSEQFKSK